MDLLQEMKTRAIAWIKSATLDDLSKLPGEIFFGKEVRRVKPASTTETVSQPADEPVARKTRRSRLRKRARGRVSKEHADLIRSRLEALEPGSKMYFTQRNKIAKELGYSARQVASAATGLIRAAKRKLGSSKR